MKLKLVKGKHVGGNYHEIQTIKVKLEKRDFIKLVATLAAVEFILGAPPSKKFQKRLVDWKNRIDGWSETHTGSNIESRSDASQEKQGL